MDSLSLPMVGNEEKKPSRPRVFSFARTNLDSVRVDRRWIVLALVCAGVLMPVLDATIVNIALPSIRQELKFPATSIAWVMNAYTLAFAGILLPSGRLADCIGHRRLFLTGVALFTTTSVTCGLANSSLILLVSRVGQGLGGAVTSASVLSLVMTLFKEQTERARALGVLGFVFVAASSVSVLIGGALTDLLGWRWVFLSNIPIGIAVFFLSHRLLPTADRAVTLKHFDILGALTMWTTLTCASYVIGAGNISGLSRVHSYAALFATVLSLALFLWIESRAPVPLIPLRFIRRRNIVTANLVGALLSAAMSSWAFVSALYLQVILGYSPIRAGLAFLPSNLVLASVSLGLSARVVSRFGIKSPLVAGLLVSAFGIELFTGAPVKAHFVTDILPGMVVIGLGGGLVSTPLLLSAAGDVASTESGLASGIINISCMTGGALGLAVLANLAASHATPADGGLKLAVLNDGYHEAFLMGAACIAAAALMGAVFLRPGIVAGRS
jgi:EmrB/QacA subfamily drug resistance transporter